MGPAPLAPLSAAELGNPLADDASVANRSRLVQVQSRGTVLDHWTQQPVHGDTAALANTLPRFVFGSDHPCVMARSVLQRGAIRVGLHDAFDASSAAVACHDLYECLTATRSDEGEFVSYAALFPTAVVGDEPAFERALWRFLQALHAVDRAHFGWDPTVSSDPDDPRFSFSIGGRAWYVVGLHPHASRLARRLEVPAIVFNAHLQFERLREEGRYTPLRDLIRERDVALQGSVNPMMRDHGRESEARQYSGRSVADSWRCPFSPDRSV